MSITVRRMAAVAVVLLLAFGLARAATFKFQDTAKKVRDACRADLQKSGLTRDAAKAKYPTPEIRMVASGCLTPGQTGDVVLNGTFAPGTQFIIENDNIQVVKESLAGGTYRATVTVAGGIGPQTAAIQAISPATCITTNRENALIISARTEWTMDASNGWHIVARPSRDPLCGDGANGEFPYDISFFRKGETTAFQKREATLHFNLYDETEPYNFHMTESTTGVAGAQDMQSLVQKMMDPKLTAAQREQVTRELQKLQEQMQANLTKMSDPAYMAKMEQDRQNFGCEWIYARVDTAGAVKGRLRCSDKVGQLNVTGTAKVLAR